MDSERRWLGTRCSQVLNLAIHSHDHAGSAQLDLALELEARRMTLQQTRAQCSAARLLIYLECGSRISLTSTKNLIIITACDKLLAPAINFPQIPLLQA
jgi:hypothetical protein